MKLRKKLMPCRMQAILSRQEMECLSVRHCLRLLQEGYKMKTKKVLEVAAIEDGTVLDHLPSEKVLKIVEILALHQESRITLGMNLESKKQGKKGIIKIEGRDLTEEEMNKIAILAPEVTVNHIKNYDVIKKKKIVLREIEPGTLRCNNPNCITNAEPVSTKFHIIEKKPLKVRCYFCELSIEKEEMIFRSEE